MAANPPSWAFDYKYAAELAEALISERKPVADQLYEGEVFCAGAGGGGAGYSHYTAGGDGITPTVYHDVQVGDYKGIPIMRTMEAPVIPDRKYIVVDYCPICGAHMKSRTDEVNYDRDGKQKRAWTVVVFQCRTVHVFGDPPKDVDRRTVIGSKCALFEARP